MIICTRINNPIMFMRVNIDITLLYKVDGPNLIDMRVGMHYSCYRSIGEGP